MNNDTQLPNNDKIIFRSSAIDLNKLNNTNGCNLILRYLCFLNSLTIIPGMAFLLNLIDLQKIQSLQINIKPIIEATNWHLLKWRLSILGEALKNCIIPLQKSEESIQYREIFKTIDNDNDVSDKWEKLKEYIKSAEGEKAQNSCLKIRDKQFFHIDETPIKEGFSKLLKKNSTDSSKANIGWHLQSINNQGLLTRSYLADEIATINFYEFMEIPAADCKTDNEKNKEIFQSTEKLLNYTINFLNSLVISYLENNDLIIKQNELLENKLMPPWSDSK